MRYFRARLWDVNSSFDRRRWLYVPYDQLSDGPLTLLAGNPRALGIVLVESLSKGSRRPYHKQKLALVISNQRQFALEQARRGVAVKYLVASSYEAGLREAFEDVGTLECMIPAEREMRHEIRPLVDEGIVVLHPNRLWITTSEDFTSACGSDRWRMDRFYRLIRRKYKILVDAAGKPDGGRWSLDAENRQKWSGDPEAPTPLCFEPDGIVQEVCQDIETMFSDHPGTLNPTALPSTATDARCIWKWAQEDCLEHFGPYEDAMSVRSGTLFHTMVSSLVNLGRLTPICLINDVLPMDIPLNSKEGFVRQILGWREFVRHVHEQSDGFRTLPDRLEQQVERDAGGAVNALGGQMPLPPVYWGVKSGFNCLDHVVAEVLDTGYTHHINRLMVLSNWATLMGASPRQLTDWFWVMFTDAYEWVVEPNVLGMGTFASADLMSTKPYVSGSAYINRMSDYCADCAFVPGKDCPLTALYWNFLNQHQTQFESNPRMKLALTAASRRTSVQKHYQADVTKRVQQALISGARLAPEGSRDNSALRFNDG
jgi:deoxyribodipyrimidine photolyase-related protein